MNQDWPTKTKDVSIAQQVMEEYASQRDMDSLGLFELVVDKQEKQMNFRLAPWVLTLAHRFNSMYGADLGEEVMRLVISCYIRQDEVIH